MERFIQVKSGKIVDTSLLLPHVECYLIERLEDGTEKLVVEEISGRTFYLGTIVGKSNNLKDLTGELEIKDVK